MRMILMILCLFLTHLSSSAFAEIKFDFYNSEFDIAKIKAGEEGKLFFVDFYAEWCSPCKWMEETSFQDVEVKEILEKDYITMQVNIDDLDGYEIKQRFNIKVLPTMLVFNSHGEMIARVEETLSARQLAKLLKFHNTEENRKKITHSVNTAPGGSKKTVTSFDPAKRKVEKQETEIKYFKIQLGVFSDRENATSLADDLSIKFAKPVTVETDLKGDRNIYRVMLGAFEQKTEANSYKKMLEEKFGMQGFVK